MICDSYYAAIRTATPDRIEAIDMGRRGLHDEGSRILHGAAQGQGGGRFRHRAPAVHADLRAALEGLSAHASRRAARSRRRCCSPAGSIRCARRWRGAVPADVRPATLRRLGRRAQGRARSVRGRRRWRRSASTSPSTSRMTFEELEDWEGLNFDLIVTLSPEAHHKALELTRTHRGRGRILADARSDRDRGQSRAAARRLPGGARPADGADQGAVRLASRAGMSRAACRVVKAWPIPSTVLRSIPARESTRQPAPLAAHRMIGRPKLVLASGSPRRLTLINQAGIEPDALQPADIDEMPAAGRAAARLRQPAGARQGGGRARGGEARRGAARRLHPRRRHRGGGRPPHPAEGRAAGRGGAMPAAAVGPQSPRPHRGLPGHAEARAFRQRLVETRVRFKRLSDEDIEAYLASGEWRGKAGGYAVQGLAGASWSRSSAPTPTWSACRSTRPRRCCPARAFRSISAGSTRCSRCASRNRSATAGSDTLVRAAWLR